MHIFLAAGIYLAGLLLGGLIADICGRIGRAGLDEKVFELEEKLMKCRNENTRLRKELKKHGRV